MTRGNDNNISGKINARAIIGKPDAGNDRLQGAPLVMIVCGEVSPCSIRCNKRFLLSMLMVLHSPPLMINAPRAGRIGLCSYIGIIIVYWGNIVMV